MVNSVVARTRSRVLLDENLECLRHLRGLLGRAAQPDEPGIESGDVLFEDLVGVTLGVRGDEQDLHSATVRSELLDGGRELTQGSRADIRAMRVPEEHYCHVAAEIRQVARLAVEVC